MKKAIVCTSINSVTEAIHRYEQMPDWELIVVGDLKSPKNYTLSHGTYLGPKDQQNIDQDLSNLIGWNCIQRRNMGILWAYKAGAEIIALVDDDNIPYEHWGKNLLVGTEITAKTYCTTLSAFDPVGAVTERHLWHRGYPLQLLTQRDYSNIRQQEIQVDIQADFWNGDPDIDAFCRMEHAPDCLFDPSSFPFASDKMAPFNSQNTFISRKVIRDYFLFPHVGRMDDIWGAYYAQAHGHKVVFNAPSVLQVRNPHNLTQDMKNEYLGYENNLEIVTALSQNPSQLLSFLPERSRAAFHRYSEHFLDE